LGFNEVYRYTRGKADWLASGLPQEGGPDEPVVGGLAQAEVPTCHLDESVDKVVSRVVNRTRWCVAVNDDRVVLGLLPIGGSASRPEQAVHEAMHAAPITVRPNATVKEARKFTRGRRREPLVVTTSDGRLVGLLERSRLRQPRSRRSESHA
jgi:CBS domain-containing protein